MRLDRAFIPQDVHMTAAGIDARSLSYVEAHGTATPLGDPIESEGLTRACSQLDVRLADARRDRHDLLVQRRRRRP